MILKKVFNLLIILVFSISSLAWADTVRDAADWFDTAQAAREQGALEDAFAALEQAEKGGFAPLRVHFERARLLTLSGDADKAIAELEAVAASGFAGLGFITGDPILSTLAGEPDFDQLVADMEARAYPCEHDEAFRAFDFWLGDWVVHDKSGSLAGTNTIERAQRGCVLIENWTSASGGTGMSMNYVDKESGEWVQVWHAEGGSQIHIRGGLTDEGMRLTGRIHYVANGTTAPFRGLWTLLDDGRVRQFFEQSADGGETWAPWFEGFYTRQE